MAPLSDVLRSLHEERGLRMVPTSPLVVAMSDVKAEPAYECMECGWPWPDECVCADGGREFEVVSPEHGASERAQPTGREG